MDATSVTKIAPTFSLDLYVSGDFHFIRQVCQEFCESGLCVSVSPVDYVFTHGMESGARVTFINYPRYPTTLEQLEGKAKALGKLITEKLGQGSFTLVGPVETYFWSRRTVDAG